MAFEVAASNEYVSNRSVRLAVMELAREAGGCGMAGGQTLDLANTVDSYRALRPKRSVSRSRSTTIFWM